MEVHKLHKCFVPVHSSQWKMGLAPIVLEKLNPSAAMLHQALPIETKKLDKIYGSSQSVRIVAVSQDLTGMFMFVSFSELIYIHTHT
jgi:hypothetical protein